MSVIVSYTNGCSDESYDLLQTAVKSLRRKYPKCVIYDAGGFKRTTRSIDSEYDVRNGRAAIIWRTERESKNDDGGHAIASINIEN